MSKVFAAQNNTTLTRLSFMDPMDHAEQLITVQECGQFICTGMYNYFIKDMDGSLYGDNIPSTYYRYREQTSLNNECSKSQNDMAWKCPGLGYTTIVTDDLTKLNKDVT